MSTHYLRAFWRALRPFSFTIALVSCALGIVLAARDADVHAGEAALVLVAGLLFQAGVNLVNDFFEFKQGKLDDKLPELALFGHARSRLEWTIFFGGLACLALVVPIGLWLTSRAGWPLLALGAVGMVAAYGYTGEPFNYKRRGLAVVLVFFLMGVLMVSGSYLALAGELPPRIPLVALPVSALVSLLLLSNELRDFEDDGRHGIRTLTVRIGYRPAAALYVALVALAYGGTIALWVAGLVPHPLLVLLSVPALRAPLRYLFAPRAERRPLTPLTARFHLVFGVAFTLTYVLPFP